MEPSHRDTIFISRDTRKPLRQIYRMAYETLLARIDERLKALGLSERKACIQAEIGINTIRHIRSRGHAPKPANLAKLATVLRVPQAYLLEAATEVDGVPSAMQLSAIFVRGAVQAGAWREAIEWQPEDWYSVTVPADPRIPPTVQRHGLEVRGSSMDRMYPEGTIVIVVRYQDLGRSPQPGDKVVVLRRAATGEFEATLKEYQVDKQGRHLLWPRSSDPEFQQPIILSGEALPLANGEEPIPPTVFAEPQQHDAGEQDLVISGLVVGSYRPEPLE